MVGMDDKQIIQEAADEVGRTLGRLQGKLFAAEAKCEALRAEIRRLDAVYQNLRGEFPAEKQLPSAAEIHCILLDKLPALDPASKPTCAAVLDLLSYEDETTTKAAIAKMERHGWRQGEAIALAQKVVQYLRST